MQKKNLNDDSLIPPPPNITVKVAFRMEGHTPLLCEIDLIKPLSRTIGWVAQKWDITDYENDILYVSSEPENIDKQWIITNENKLSLKAGSILCLMNSPFIEMNDLVAKLNSKYNDKNVEELLEHLKKFSGDLSYARRYLEKGGLKLLTRITFESTNESDEVIDKGLKSLKNLFDSMLINVHDIPDGFLGYIEYNIKRDDVSLKTLASLYLLISSLLCAFPEFYDDITTFINHVKMIEDFSKDNADVVFAVISCLNVIFILTPNNDKMALRNLIYKNEFRERVYKVLTTEKLKLNEYTQKHIKMLEYIVLYDFFLFVMTRIEENSSKEYLDRFKKIYFTVFPDEEGGSNDLNYQKLGCQQNNDPLMIFRRYPGFPTFICIEHYATHHKEDFKRLISTQQTSEIKSSWSFVLASSAITKEIITYFRLSENITFTYNLPTFHPVVFSCSDFFQELYALLINHFNKTWQGLKSNSFDFNKVIAIVKEQMKIALSENIDTLNTLKHKLEKIDPASIMNMITIDRSISRTLDAKHPTVRSMKEFLRPKIISAIHKQRLIYISDGAVFLKAKSKRGSVFCCYHSKTESIYFGDSDCPLAIDDLPGKIDCPKITSVLLSDGATLAPSKNASKKGYLHVFSIVYGENDETLDLAAKTQVEFDYWIDGLNILMGKPLNSLKYIAEYTNLMELSLRISLIDLEDVELAETIPPIPPLPPAIDGKLPKL